VETAILVLWVAFAVAAVTSPTLAYKIAYKRRQAQLQAETDFFNKQIREEEKWVRNHSETE
jgi:hypothetical protein